MDDSDYMTQARKIAIRDRAEAVVVSDYIVGADECPAVRRPGSDVWNIRCSDQVAADIWRTVEERAGPLMANGIQFKAEVMRPGGAEPVYR